MMILYWLANIVSIVCWIFVLVKMFQSNKIGLGILSIICGIVAFVWGWQNVGKVVPKNVMLAWTVAFVLGIIAGYSSGMMTGQVTTGG